MKNNRIIWYKKIKYIPVEYFLLFGQSLYIISQYEKRRANEFVLRLKRYDENRHYFPTDPINHSNSIVLCV